MAASATTLSSFSSLSLHPSSYFKPFPTSRLSNFSFTNSKTPSFPLSTKPHTVSLPKAKSEEDEITTFFDELNPEGKVTFDPPTPPEDYEDPLAFDDQEPETEEEIARAYEELYGPGFSGVSHLGNDIYVMDAQIKKKTGIGGEMKTERIKDGFEERVVQVRRVTKVVKGGKQLHFRSIVIVGDKQGQVGVGVGKAKEVISAVMKAAVNARRNVITIPLTKYSTFPHRSDGRYGAAQVMLRPASPGTGVIAGGAVRVVLEMAGVENALGKQIRSNNALNNARATVVAIQKMRQFSDVSRERGIPIEQLWQ